MTPQRSEVILVGAGPIGLELAVALKRAGIDYLHLDARQIGYTISWFAPQTKFFSSNDRIAIAGVPLMTPDQTKVTREQYLTYLRGIVLEFDLKINTYEAVVGIERVADDFVVRTRAATGGRTYRAGKIVLATGGTERPRRLNVPGEDLPHVSHYFQDPHDYFARKLLVVGGKNSAVEAVLRSHHAGAQVSLSYRRDQLPAESIKYWLMPEMTGLIKSGKLGTYFRTQVVEILPGYVKLRRESGEVFDVEADFVLLLVGYEQDKTLFEMTGVKLMGDDEAPAYDDRTMETNVPGIYVAGTAVGGTQRRFRVFIENCHVHAERIVAALTGSTPPPAPAPLALPES